MTEKTPQKTDFRQIAYVLVTRVKFLLQFFLCLLAATRVSLLHASPAKDPVTRLTDLAQWLLITGFGVLAVEFAWRMIYPRRRHDDVT